MMYEDGDKGVVISQGRQRAYKVHGSSEKGAGQRISDLRFPETIGFKILDYTYTSFFRPSVRLASGDAGPGKQELT